MFIEILSSDGDKHHMCRIVGHRFLRNKQGVVVSGRTAGSLHTPPWLSDARHSATGGLHIQTPASVYPSACRA